jgi:hypothetical protein
MKTKKKKKKLQANRTVDNYSEKEKNAKKKRKKKMKEKRKILNRCHRGLWIMGLWPWEAYDSTLKSMVFLCGTGSACLIFHNIFFISFFNHINL